MLRSLVGSEMCIRDRASVNITFQVMDSFQGTTIENWAEISQADDDDDPTNPFPTDEDSDDDNGSVTEDGDDPEVITIVQEFDLALVKN